jgi:hypothetical protein
MALVLLRICQELLRKVQAATRPTSGQTLAPTLARSLHPNDHGSGASWAHVSGWAQLSGKRHTVSCIVPCHQTAAAGLANLLPVLSDTLTEYGYPWETITVDCDNTPQTRRVLSPWIELPGFRWVPGRAGCQRLAAVALGLCAARGDVVIVVDPTERRVPAFIAEMIARWESGARLLYSVNDTWTEASPSVWPEHAAPQHAQTHLHPNLRAAMSCVSLIDGRLVEPLTRDSRSWASPR